MTGYSSELSASPTNNKQTNKTKLVEQIKMHRELSSTKTSRERRENKRVTVNE